MCYSGNCRHEGYMGECRILKLPYPCQQEEEEDLEITEDQFSLVREDYFDDELYWPQPDLLTA
jgi:hypothetical protein